MIQDFNDAFLTAMRQQGDTAADEFVAQCMSSPQLTPALYGLIDPEKPALSKSDFIDQFPFAQALAGAVTLPGWANFELMQAGSKLFTRYPETIMSLLGLLSLPYCYAAADGAAVLFLSERMRNDTTVRLYQTALFVWRMMEPGAFEPNGNALHEVLKIRVTHAVVRYHTVKHKWDSALGLPINQEDMAGTNLAFSLIVLRGLKQFGLPVENNEAAGFLHLWRVIGHLSGIDERLLTDNEEVANQLDSAIHQRHFRRSPQGVQLTAALIDHIYRVNQKKVQKKDIAALLRHLLGAEIADLLEIPKGKLALTKWWIICVLQQYKGLWFTGSTTQRYNNAYQKFLRAPILSSVKQESS